MVDEKWSESWVTEILRCSSESHTIVIATLLSDMQIRQEEGRNHYGVCLTAASEDFRYPRLG